MATDIERQFFDTFGIEPKEITDRILLELVCVANKYEDYPDTTNIENIKARTLRILLRMHKFYKNFYENDKRYKKFKKQVQALFEENNNDR